jgi:rod shape-determining protein MreB
MGFFSRASAVAIDLGTANTCIFADGAVALNEPSIVAFNNVRGAIEAVGTDAHEMIGRTPVNITSVRPIRHGVIADFDAVEKLLEHFVKKVSGRGYPRPRIVIGVPPASTQVERRAVKDSASRLKAREVLLVDESMSAGERPTSRSCRSPASSTANR